MQSAGNNLASVGAVKSPGKIHASMSSLGRSPSRKMPSTSVLLRELHAAQAALKGTQPTAPVQTTQKVASHSTQDRFASSSTLKINSLSRAQVEARLSNLSSNSAHPTPVSVPSTPIMTAKQSSNLPVVSSVPSVSQPAPSSPTAGSRPPPPPQFASRANAPSSNSPYLPNLTTSSTHVFRAPVPQVYDARGGWASQTPTPSSAEQITQRIYQLLMPSLTSIETRQATTTDQLLVSDQMLRDLVIEVKSLSDKEKERAKKEVEREEREKNTVKALLLLAERTEGVKKGLANIEAVIGVENTAFGNVSMLSRLGKIEMSVEEWLERLRDPKADSRSYMLP